MHKQINKYDYLSKINYCSTCVLFKHVLCFFMCILFYVFFIWLHVYAFAIHSMVHYGSAFQPGASGLPYYCASTWARSFPAVLGALAVWIQNQKTNQVWVSPPEKKERMRRVQLRSRKNRSLLDAQPCPRLQTWGVGCTSITTDK